MTVASNNKTSILVPSQLPEFVREDHNTFVQFVQSYYKFLEDKNYKKAVKSNLFVSTKAGPAGAYQNTDIVVLTSSANNSNVALSNGAKVSIDGTVTIVSNVIPTSNTFTVNPPVPIRIVQGDLYVYEDRASDANNHVMDITKNWSRYLDVDIATTDNDQIKQKIYDNFIKLLPKNIIADKTLITKHAKDFYRARGSEKSVQFLLRALYNTESEIYYPKNDILRASDGKWYVEKSIRITDTMVDNISNSMADSLFVGKTITGVQSLATAIVEGLNVYYKNGALVTELIVSNSSRPFLSDENIFANFQDVPTGPVKYASATIFGGQIVETEIVEGGTGYLEGMLVPVIPTDNTGNGARIIVSKVSRGGINRIYVGANNIIGLEYLGGAGYRVDDLVLVTGGGGTGALGGVESVWDNNRYHPNTYNVCSTRLYDVANYTILATQAAAPNLKVLTSNTVANTVIANSFYSWTYGPTGPAKFCYVLTEGQDYGTGGYPSFSIQANTIVRSLGILGKMVIVDGGLNYAIDDVIEFTNPNHYGYGAGATANVTNVAANGMITEVHFVEMSGHIIGGSGYNQDHLPTCNVASATGNGANIVVTNILGTGGVFSFTTESLGIIKAIKILEGGSAYTTTPILDLTNLGDGTAQVIPTTVTGIYSYPGRYISDDGFLSSKNKLEDRDYYQNFSYVIKSQAPISRYKPILKSLTHPAGMKMFGRYEVVDVATATMNGVPSFDSSNTISISANGLMFYLDTANTIDSLTGLGYEYGIYDINNDVIYDRIYLEANALGIAIDTSNFDETTTWTSLVDFGYIGYIYNGAQINPETGILRLDGTNEYSYFPSNQQLDLSTLTLEAWFSPDTLYQDGFILEKGFRNEQYGLLLQQNRTIGDSELIWRVTLDGYIKDAIKVRSSQNLRQDGWNHVVITHKSGQQVMYINGKSVRSNNVSGLMASPPGGITIGASGETSGTNAIRTYYYEGNIGIIRIYDRILSSQEVGKNFNREKIRFGL